MKLLNNKYLHTMISDKIRNMVCLEYDYLPLTLVKLVPLSRPVHVEMRGEMNSHWDSEHHKQVLNVKQTLYVGFPLWDRFSSFLTCHTLIPTSYIHDLSCRPGRSLLPRQNGLTLTFVNSPRLLCVYISHHSLPLCEWWKLLPY